MDFEIGSGVDTAVNYILDNFAPMLDAIAAGIGAAAGGLAAVEAIFCGMPVDTHPGKAFVLVQHLAPDHKSLLVDLIRRYTRMQVFEVEDGMAVLPDCVYIIPPNHDMVIARGASAGNMTDEVRRARLHLRRVQPADHSRHFRRCESFLAHLLRHLRHADQLARVDAVLFAPAAPVFQERLTTTSSWSGS